MVGALTMLSETHLKVGLCGMIAALNVLNGHTLAAKSRVRYTGLP